MCDEESTLSIDVIDALALPCTSVAELELAVAGWHFVNDSAIDVRRALMAADLSAADIVLVELAPKRAKVHDISAAFAAASLAPSDVVDVIRLIAATEPSRWQSFPFVCLAPAAARAGANVPFVDCAGGLTVVLTAIALQDEDSNPEVGWSDHVFGLARHSSKLR